MPYVAIYVEIETKRNKIKKFRTNTHKDEVTERKTKRENKQ